MDLTIFIGIAMALVAIIATMLFFIKRNLKKDEHHHQHQRGAPMRMQAGVPRRAQIARNQRNRLRQHAGNIAGAADVVNDAGEQADEEDSDNAEGTVPQGAVLDEKMGAKKRAKMEAKEQKRLQREFELKKREEQKAKDAKDEEERKRQEDAEAEQERKQVEAERLAREERERKEYEEYLKMKEAFSVEEEGYGEADDAEKEHLLTEFIQYIRDNKVVVLEDLATEFKLKTQEAIDRIQQLQADGTLTGVIDDRGKFIYISEEELQAVTKFIKQRGRVSIAELAESSNKLINLAPVGTI